MATLYGKGRGKARSHAPKTEKPYWLKLKESEIEQIIVKLAKQGFPPAKIGLILRDKYGVPSVKAITNKKIQKILQEKGITTQHDELIALKKKVAELLKKES